MNIWKRYSMRVSKNWVKFNKMFTLSPWIVQQHHAMFCMKEDTDSPSYREFWRDLVNGHSQHGTFHRVGKQGKEIWLEATYFPVSQGGKIIKIIKIASDDSAT